MSGPEQQTVLSLTPEAALAVLAARASEIAGRAGARRVLIGLAGGPGVGKSTLATALVERLNAIKPGAAAYVPMDGFHMRQSKLEALGTVRDKGAPHTFEAEAFAGFLARLKGSRETMSAPGYSRKIEDVVDDMLSVPGGARILVAEGNYLLLDGPWAAVRPLLDLAAFLHVDREIVRRRLLARHAAEGLFTEARNREHVERVDLANYDLVGASRERAGLVLELLTDERS